MKVAIIGSRNITNVDIGKYIDVEITEIVSGGAIGVDSIAKEYAEQKGIPFIEFKPEYNRYHKGAPIKRNEKIADYADIVIAFWDGKSKGTKHTVNYCEKTNVKCIIIKL
ncbi:MAG: SLOG family protein [Bacillota bacterium]